MSLLYQDDIGVSIIISTSNTTIPETATLTLLVEKPGQNTVEWTVTPEMINLTTGVITYTTVDGDLDEVGVYKLQVHGVFSDADYYSNIDKFTVHERLELI
jgi:hypothetical protein